jgi:YedE family putative selenium metabolism protein
MGQVKNFLGTRWGIVSVGAFIGVFAPLLQKLGNPGNMGVCVACFERDIAGAIGLHRAAVVQYMRPEIIGFVIGALIAAYAFREFRPRVGSAPIVRFVLGVFAMIGALVFLGCPWRAMLRLTAGDGNAILGLLGLVVGIWIGTFFLKAGYNLGRSNKTYTSVGWLMPLIMLGFLVLLLSFAQIKDEPQSGILFYSINGPGAMHAPIAVSLIIGLGIGFLAQRSRFCTMGAFRDLILFRIPYLLSLTSFWDSFIQALQTNLWPTPCSCGTLAGWSWPGWPFAWPVAARAASYSWPGKEMVMQPSLSLA